ncbi:MAG: CGNR zinc finger domain-containing protein [Rhizobiaceae bacterium]|nr:CGNR zinc finger domain-containing protein [Rhizobiaceae bacterium]
MIFQWNPHRFSGGALALDVANSVILRFDPARCIDRFAVPEQLGAFPDAAARLSVERDALGALDPVAPARQARLIALREAIDAHFRHRALHGEDDNRLLAALLSALSEILAAHPEPADRVPLDLATARSAIGLLASPETGRLKICPECEWLFIDRSKNRSRNWCDMAVCGNRTKARLHYGKKRKGSAR